MLRLGLRPRLRYFLRAFRTGTTNCNSVFDIFLVRLFAHPPKVLLALPPLHSLGHPMGGLANVSTDLYPCSVSSSPRAWNIYPFRVALGFSQTLLSGVARFGGAFLFFRPRANFIPSFAWGRRKPAPQDSANGNRKQIQKTGTNTSFAVFLAAGVR